MRIEQYAAENGNTRAVKWFKLVFSNSLMFTFILSAAAKSAKKLNCQIINHVQKRKIIGVYSILYRSE